MSSQGGSQAKESFLNYFFGGQNGGTTLPVVPTHQSRRSDVGVQRSDNPLAGRKGLEGTAAAFDMKSLEKHMLEPVSEWTISSASTDAFVLSTA